MRIYFNVKLVIYFCLRTCCITVKLLIIAHCEHTTADVKCMNVSNFL